MSDFDSILNAKLFANAFREICSGFRTPVMESSDRKNTRKLQSNLKVLDYLCRVKESINRGRCDEAVFKNSVMSKCCHIEVLWYLLRTDILEDEDITQMFSSGSIQLTKDVLTDLFEEIFFKNHLSEMKRELVSDFMNCLLKHKKSSNHIIPHGYTFMMELVGSQTALDVSKLNNSLLFQLNLDGDLHKQFVHDVVKAMLVQNPNNSVSYQSTLQKNEHFLKVVRVSKREICPLLRTYSLDEITLLFNDVFRQDMQSLNWDNLFELLSQVFSHFEEAHKPIKTLIQFLLDDALNSSNNNSLLYVFILSRQCAYPPSVNFPSYLQWFSSTFSSESVRPINTKERAAFFMAFLTEIARYDSSYYLKVHINRVPFLPIDCQGLLSDYVALVKIILLDLNESIELGIFENLTDKNSAEYDVETVLNIFSNTNDVPKCVLEASLFCKFYYEKKFLPELLSKYEGKTSVRHKFIIKLQSLGKIPNSQFLKYKQLI